MSKISLFSQLRAETWGGDELFPAALRPMALSPAVPQARDVTGAQCKAPHAKERMVIF